MDRDRKLDIFEDKSIVFKGKYGLDEGQNYKPCLREQDVKFKRLFTLFCLINYQDKTNLPCDIIK